MLHRSALSRRAIQLIFDTVRQVNNQAKSDLSNITLLTPAMTTAISDSSFGRVHPTGSPCHFPRRLPSGSVHLSCLFTWKARRKYITPTWTTGEFSGGHSSNKA